MYPMVSYVESLQFISMYKQVRDSLSTQTYTKFYTNKAFMKDILTLFPYISHLIMDNVM